MMFKLLKRTSTSILLIGLCHFALAKSLSYQERATNFSQFKNKIAQ